MAAILQFTQNAISPGPGISAVGVAGLPVTVQSVAPGGGAINTFEMLDVPLTSAVPTGMIYSGPASACFFTPDAPPGCYRIRLTVTGVGAPQVTIKNFAVPTAIGNLILPSFNSRAIELNFPGNTEGWEQILNEWLLYLLAASGGGNNTVKATVADTTADYLLPKLVAGAGILLTLLNPGGYEQVVITNTGGAGGWPVPDNVFAVNNVVDPTKFFLIDASGQATGTATTLYLGATVARPFRLPDISGTAVVQQDVTGQVFIGIGVTGSLHGSNAGIQYSTLTGNRAQFRGNQYGTNTGVAGVTGFKSRGLTIGSLGGLIGGDLIARLTAIGVCPDNVSMPLAGTATFQVPPSFVAAGQNYLPAEFQIQLAATSGPTNSIRPVFQITSDGETRTLRGIRAGGPSTLPANLATGTLWSSGAGGPNGVITGSVGDLYTDTAGGAGSTLWVKESGTNTNTGWVAAGAGGGAVNEDTAVCAVAVTAGQPMAMLATGLLAPADAAVVGQQEVYGLAKAAAGPGPVTVITSGICAYTGPALTPGVVQYLAVSGGFSTTPPPLATAGRIIFRLGQARAAGSILVNRQFLAYT